MSVARIRGLDTGPFLIWGLRPRLYAYACFAGSEQTLKSQAPQVYSVRVIISASKRLKRTGSGNSDPSASIA